MSETEDTRGDSITISEAIEQLQAIAKESPFGTDTVLYLCLPGVEFIPIDKIAIEKDDCGAIGFVKADLKL